jgi:hypothetical protein
MTSIHRYIYMHQLQKNIHGMCSEEREKKKQRGKVQNSKQNPKICKSKIQNRELRPSPLDPTF